MPKTMEPRLFLGRYQALRPLGEGGMGRVYLARQRDKDRLVVVKVLHEKHALTGSYRETFRREIESLARFRHPGAVELYEASLDSPDGPCLVMEYVEGPDLEVLLRHNSRLDPGRVGRLLGKLCAVLQAAHDLGVTHRDLKPANILVADAGTPAERVKLLDFGLARLEAPGTGGFYIPMDQLTDSPELAFAGTPEYACPEQLKGEEVGPAGDIYSVGVILYELLTGRRPFDAPVRTDVIAAHLMAPPPPFTFWGVQNVPPRVEEVVRACLAKDPAGRPPSPRELALRFGEALGQSIWNEEEAAAAAAPVPAPPAAEKDDPNAVTYRLEAWMPERVAVIKLRGFLGEMDGEVTESVPGLIRVRLRKLRPQAARPAAPAGFFARLGFGRRPAPAPEFDPVDMDVYLGGQEPGPPGKLPITIRLRSANGAPAGADWRPWCDRVHASLCSYLMVRR